MEGHADTCMTSAVVRSLPQTPSRAAGSGSAGDPRAPLLDQVGIGAVQTDQEDSRHQCARRPLRTLTARCPRRPKTSAIGTVRPS